MYWSSRRAEVALGLAAGVASTAISHPLDLLKVRLQLQRQRTSRVFDLIKTLISAINADAVSAAARGNHRLPIAYYHLQQWYRGVAPNLVGNAAAWSLYFVFYAEFKDLLASRGDRSPSTAPTTSYFGASALAGITTSVITNPLWVLKTRILATPRGVTGSYVSMADAIRFILRDEGIATFWRGTIPSLFLVPGERPVFHIRPVKGFARDHLRNRGLVVRSFVMAVHLRLRGIQNRQHVSSIPSASVAHTAPGKIGCLGAENHLWRV